MAKKGKGCKSHPKGDSWKEDYYSRHAGLEAKVEGIRAVAYSDPSRGDHQKSTPPATKEEQIPEVVNAYQSRRKQGIMGTFGIVE